MKRPSGSPATRRSGTSGSISSTSCSPRFRRSRTSRKEPQRHGRRRSRARGRAIHRHGARVRRSGRAGASRLPASRSSSSSGSGRASTRWSSSRWDARDGGAYRYVHTDGNNEHGFRGVFHSMAMDNMVQTFEYDGAPGHVSLDTQVLEDLGGGRTRLKPLGLHVRRRPRRDGRGGHGRRRRGRLQPARRAPAEAPAGRRPPLIARRRRRPTPRAPRPVRHPSGGAHPLPSQRSAGEDLQDRRDHGLDGCHVAALVDRDGVGDAVAPGGDTNVPRRARAAPLTESLRRVR